MIHLRASAAPVAVELSASLAPDSVAAFGSSGNLIALEAAGKTRAGWLAYANGERARPIAPYRRHKGRYETGRARMRLSDQRRPSGSGAAVGSPRRAAVLLVKLREDVLLVSQ